MKKLYLTLLLFLMLSLGLRCYAADTKVSDLDDIAAPALGDDMYIVDDPDGTPASKKISVGVLLGVAAHLDTSGNVFDFALTTDADAGDFDIDSLDRLEFFDAGIFVDGGTDGVFLISSDGTLEIATADWAISTTGVMTGFGAITSDAAITAGTSFIIGGADMDETDLEKLDGVTNGTAAANKAVVLDGSLDIATINSLTATTLVGALTGNADTCTTASAGDAAVDFFGAGVDAVTDATTCTDIEGTLLAITAGTLNATEAQTLAAVLALGADANDVATTSWAKMEGFDAGLFIDWDTDAVFDITSDGTLELHSADWDIGATGIATGMGNITSDGTIEGATLTEGGVAIINATEGGTWTGAHDFGGATSLEIPNTAGDVTVDAEGEIAVDTTQKQLAVYDGLEIAIPLRHMIFGPLGLDAAFDRNANLVMLELDTTIFPDGIVITAWSVDATVADPTTELDANLKYCDDPGAGAFPGANPVLIDVIDTTTGNSAETDMSQSDLGSGVIPAAKFIYILMDADPVDTDNYFMVKINFYIPES